MAKKNNNSKIVKYRKPVNFNIGMIIFAVIFIYILVCVILFFNTKHIVGYEVTTGSLTISNIYEGVAIREEMTVSANNPGYVNYFAREGSHVACGDLVYTVDQSGTLVDMMQSGDENIMLSDADLNELRTDIMTFSHNFDETSYASMYDFKYSLEGTTLKLSNYNMLANMDQIKNSGNAVNFCYAPVSGTVVYSVDGLEDLQPEEVNESIFDTKEHEKTQLVGNDLIGKDDTVYKMITSEDWSIMIPVPEERAVALEDEGYVEVKFLKNQYKSWAAVSIMRLADGAYAKLDFNNSMSIFATDRYINIEILEDTDVGLKIPNSAIAERTFYLVPKEYITSGKGSGQDGVLLEVYNEDGTSNAQFVETKIYNETDDEVYIDTSTFRIGDTIIKPSSAEEYTISKSASLIGVYNINKGYADFTEITILSENEEYSIVQSNTQYGLSEYDHIVLDASSVDADDFIH